MPRPKPQEEPIYVAFKVPKSIHDELERIGGKMQSPETGAAFTVPLLCRKLVIEGMKKYQGKKR